MMETILYDETDEAMPRNSGSGGRPRPVTLLWMDLLQQLQQKLLEELHPADKLQPADDLLPENALQQPDALTKQPYGPARQALLQKLLAWQNKQAKQLLMREPLMQNTDVPLSWTGVSRLAPLTIGQSAGLLATILARGPYQSVLSRFSFPRPADGRMVEACTSLPCLAAAMDDVDALALLLQAEQLWNASPSEDLPVSDFAARYWLAQMGQDSEAIHWLRVLPDPAGHSGAEHTLTTRDPLAAAIFCGAMHTALWLLPETPAALSADARSVLALPEGDDPLADSVRAAVCCKYGLCPEEMRRRFRAEAPAARADVPFSEETARILAQQEQPPSAAEHAQFLQEMCARYGLAPGEDWRKLEPLARLDMLFRQNAGNPTPAAARETVELLVRRVCELDDDIMLPVLYEAIPELFLTPMHIPPAEERGEAWLDAVCYCALLGSNRCLAKLLALGANADGLHCVHRVNRLPFSDGSASRNGGASRGGGASPGGGASWNGDAPCDGGASRDSGRPRLLPVTPLDCALYGKNEQGRALLMSEYGSRTAAEISGGVPMIRPPESAPHAVCFRPELVPGLYEKLLRAIRCWCEPVAQALLAFEAVQRLSYEDKFFLQIAAIECDCPPKLFRALTDTFRLYSREANRLIAYAAKQNRPTHLRLLLHLYDHYHIDWLQEDLLAELVQKRHTACLSVLIRRQRGKEHKGLDLWLQAETDPTLRAAWRLTGPPEDFACGAMPAQGPVPLPRSMTGLQAARLASPAQLRRFSAEHGALSLPEARRCRTRIAKEIKKAAALCPPYPQETSQCAQKCAGLLDALLESCPPLLEEFSTQRLLVLLCLLPDEPPAALLDWLTDRKCIPLVLRAGDPFTMQSLLAEDGFLDRWQQRLGAWFSPAILRDAPPRLHDKDYSGFLFNEFVWPHDTENAARLSAALPALLSRCAVWGKAPAGRLSRLAAALLRFGTPELIMQQCGPGGMLPDEDTPLLLEYCRPSRSELPAQNRAALTAGLKVQKIYVL